MSCSVPVIDDDSSDARNVTRPATSSALVVASGAFSSKSATISGMSHMPSVRPVRTSPGPIALTRIPRGPSSIAATCASIASAAFELQYALIPAAGCTAFRLAVKMIDPPSRIARAACLVVRNGPNRLTLRSCASSRWRRFR